MKVGKIKKRDKKINYKIFKRSKKNIILKINNEGEVEISIPKRSSYKDGENTIKINFDKIYLKVEEKEIKHREKLEKDYIKILGKDVKKDGRDVEVVLLDECKITYNDLLGKWIPIVGISPKKIRIRKMKTAWGICYSNGNITLNLKLIQMDRKIIEYVIVHELCHFHHMNHSKEFWDLVEKYLPNFREEKKRLKSIQKDLNYFT